MADEFATNQGSHVQIDANIRDIIIEYYIFVSDNNILFDTRSIVLSIIFSNMSGISIMESEVVYTFSAFLKPGQYICGAFQIGEH